MLPDGSFASPQSATFTERWYQSLPAFYRDADRDLVLRRFLDLLGGQADEVDVLNDQADDGIWTNPDLTPDLLVPWLAQICGITTSGPVTINSLRERLSTLGAVWGAGNPASIRAAAIPLLIGEKWCLVRPHEGQTTGDPWLIGVFVRESEAPSDLSTLVGAITAAGVKPAGWGIIIRTVSVTWESIHALGDTWGEIQSAGGTWADLENAAWNT